MSRRGRSRSPFSLFSFQDIITCVSGIIILITLMLAVELSQRKQSSVRAQNTLVATRLREAIESAQAEIAALEAQLAQGASRALELAGASPTLLGRDLFQLQEQIQSLQGEIESLRRQEQSAEAADEKMQARKFDRRADVDKAANAQSRAKDLEAEIARVQKQNKVFYNPRTADGRRVWLVQIEARRLLVAPADQPARAEVLSAGFLSSVGAAFADWLNKRSAAADFIFLLVKPEGQADFSEIKNLLAKRGFELGFDLLGTGQSAVQAGQEGAAP